MGQVYQCWCRICQEINVFSRFEYHMFYILRPFVTYLLTPLYIYNFIFCLVHVHCLHILLYYILCFIEWQFNWQYWPHIQMWMHKHWPKFSGI
jgi:hypothetical protein